MTLSSWHCYNDGTCGIASWDRYNVLSASFANNTQGIVNEPNNAGDRNCTDVGLGKTLCTELCFDEAMPTAPQGQFVFAGKISSLYSIDCKF